MGSGGDGEPEAISSIAPLLLRPSVVLEVQDTGTGIPAEELPHIFERFHRVKGARGRSYEGSGIGLALVQELVKLHSGTIQVNSVVDQGTCFTIAIPMGFAHLPRECIGATRTLASTATGAMPYVEEMLRWSSKSIDSSDARASELSVSIPVQSQVSSAPTARVLLVDDNADLRDYLKRLLSQQYEVETVADGVSALAAIRQQMPDLVLTDVMMPGMDGFELLQSLRSDSTTQDIPIILLSARAGEEARIEGLEAGADDYLTKPFSARELLARIEANLKLAQLRREATQREQALRLAAEAAQQKVETILSSISDGFYTLDRNWCFTYVNDRVCEIAGMPREALLGFNVWELFPEAVEADAYPQLHRAMGERVAVQFEYFHSPRNCWIENRGYPSPDGVAVFLADITDRKRVEAERRQAEAEIQQLNQQLNHRITELQTLFDLLPVGVAIAEDPECRTIHANPYLSELIRVPIEVNASQSAPPDERPLYRLCRNGEEIPVENLPMQYAASQNTGVKDEIVDIVHPDGTVVKLLSYCSPLLDEQGNVRGVLGAFVDITQRVATETALRESEERLKLAVEAGRMVAWEWNPFDNTIITSSNFSEIYGLSELQAAEQGFALLHPEDRSRHQATVEQAVVTSSSYHSEFRIIRPDTGAIVWLEERGQAILNSAGNLQKLIGVAIDITERKRAEEALRISRDRLAFVLNNTGIGLWLNSLPLNDLNWDNRTREFFFVLPDVEPTFDLFWSRLHPDDREPTRLAVEAALRDRTLYQIDHRAVNPDTGEIRWIRSAGKATYASDGIPIRFDGINYDITDRKQTEQALRQAEERLRVALQNAPITVFNQDHELKYTWIHNPVLHDLQEMLGKHDRDFLPPEDAEPLTTIKQRVLETGIGVREEIKVTRDRTHYYDLTVEPLRDANNTVVGITCAAVDVSELKQAEIDLRKSEERLRLAMEGAQMGTWDLDLITGKAIWSELHFTMLGYEPVSTGEATEAMWHSCIHPDDLERVMQEWQQARQERRIYQTEYRVVRADNQQISWLAGLGSFTYNQNGEAIRSLGVLFDVTDRKQSEQMLIEQKQLLELIATGHSLDECLSAICTSVSKLNPNTRACVLLTDAERLTFPRSITPDFPPSFGQGLKDAPINELCIGTCGEAVHCGEPVTCADIANDDRWSQEWRDLCVAHGILACHSSPIFGLEGLSLGSLMLCFNEARIPTDWEYQLANFGTQVASIAFERDRSSLALRESEARFRNMADNAPFMVWVTDPTGCCTYLSQSWYDFSGQTPEIGLGYGWLNAVHPDDQESARATFLAANDRHESFRLEYRLRRKDGEYSWAIDAATPWFGEDGQCKGYVGSVIDISDRKQIEVALQQNEDRLRLAIEAAQLGTWDWNLSTNELLLDEVGKTLFGLLPEAEASFEDCFERLHPDDRERLKQVVQSSLNPASGGTYDAEYRTVSLQGGVERWIKAKGQVYFDPAGHPRRFIGTLLDITEQKRAETEREQLLAREQAAREAAEAANRIKDEFLAVVSHELRSPLNPILGWSKLLRSRQLDEQKTDRALEVIERNAQMQAQLINDLLDVSRILRGKLSLDTKPVDLVTTIQAAMETVRLAAAAKSIQINTQFEPDVGQVAGDAGRLQQVIWNLLTNAVKFTSEGGRVDIRLERIDSQAQITITDTGKGIPPDFLPYVFEQFRQESSATTRRFGGLGLGLAIVRYLVELHGGTVQADSQGEGMGATFTVKFPLMPHQPITKPDPKPSELSLNLQGTRILVVDDDDNTREFLAFLLELHGANVIATATAGEALTTLTQFKPDVLLSDIGMPDVDGYMLMRQVRALPPEQGGTIPAIALTAYAGEIDYQQAMAAGFQRHIAKPIEPEILIQAIATLLEQT
jgi:PAS domain S-box-containing protein